MIRIRETKLPKTLTTNERPPDWNTDPGAVHKPIPPKEGEKPRRNERPPDWHTDPGARPVSRFFMSDPRAVLLAKDDGWLKSEPGAPYWHEGATDPGAVYPPYRPPAKKEKPGREPTCPDCHTDPNARPVASSGARGIAFAKAKKGAKRTPPVQTPPEDGGYDDGRVHGPDGPTPGGIDRGSDDSTWDGAYDSPGAAGSEGEFLGFARFAPDARVLLARRGTKKTPPVVPPTDRGTGPDAADVSGIDPDTGDTYVPPANDGSEWDGYPGPSVPNDDLGGGSEWDGYPFAVTMAEPFPYHPRQRPGAEFPEDGHPDSGSLFEPRESEPARPAPRPRIDAEPWNRPYDPINPPDELWGALPRDGASLMLASATRFRGPQDHPVFDPKRHRPTPPNLNNEGYGVHDPSRMIRGGGIRGPIDDGFGTRTERT